jgi:hypothetical protein
MKMRVLVGGAPFQNYLVLCSFMMWCLKSNSVEQFKLPSMYVAKTLSKKYSFVSCFLLGVPSHARASLHARWMSRRCVCAVTLKPRLKHRNNVIGSWNSVCVNWKPHCSKWCAHFSPLPCVARAVLPFSSARCALYRVGHEERGRNGMLCCVWRQQKEKEHPKSPVVVSEPAEEVVNPSAVVDPAAAEYRVCLLCGMWCRSHVLGL